MQGALAGLAHMALVSRCERLSKALDTTIGIVKAMHALLSAHARIAADKKVVGGCTHLLVPEESTVESLQSSCS